MTRCKYAVIASAMLFSISSATFAEEENTHITIPMMDHAQVFADFTDDMPAVLNYFTRANEQEIIDFYQEKYGTVLSQERKRGRLTLSFQQEDKSMRVVISQQNNKRQVDIIVEPIEK